MSVMLQVLAAVRANHNLTQAYMAREFQKNNPTAVCGKFAKELQGDSDLIRAAHGIQEPRARCHRINPHRRHGSIREHDLGFRLIEGEMKRKSALA
jgi:hypothetical protein